MKHFLIITATTLSICATLSAMEISETFEQFPIRNSQRPKGPGKKVVKLRQLGESFEQTSPRESKLVKGPEMTFVNLRPLGQAKL